jgi:hypothetical protein
MSEDKYDLDLFIKNSFEETIEYLKKNNIQIEGKLSLTSLESYDEYQQKYGRIPISDVGVYDVQANEIIIIKNGLKVIINREVNNPNKIFIGNLFTITLSRILWPVYKNDNDIEKIIAKTVTDLIVAHEIGHAVFRYIDEWKASAFEFLVYFYKNELYKYPEVYEIMDQNMKICERFIKKKDPSLSYSLGLCFANNLIYIYENILNKDKQSPKLDIKNTIEKLKYFSRDDEIDATKMINTLTKILILLYK